MNVTKAVLRLYLIQFFSFWAVSLSMFFPGLDLVFTVAYLSIVLIENRLNSHNKITQKVLIALFWQGPAVFFASYTFLACTFWDLNNYAIFLLQFWGAPLLPVWSLFDISTKLEFPLYYYLILITPIALIIYSLLGSINFAVNKSANPLAASNK